MNIVLRALCNLWEAQQGAPTRAGFLIDQGATDEVEVRRLLTPWADWLTPVFASTTAPLIAAHCDIVVILSDDGQTVNVLHDAARLGGVPSTDAGFPANPRALALMQEVAHHDYQLGGFNEWLGTDAEYAAPVLQHLSAVHCQRAFSSHIPDILAPLRADMGTPLAALDVGCGSISRLRWGGH